MAKISRPTNPDVLLTSRRSYSIWASTVASLAKTPRNLDRPRKELTDLELAAAVIPDMRRELVELWEAFTLNRAEVSRYLMDPKKEALTYLLGFHLSNLARAQGMLRRAEHRMGLFSWLRQQGRPLHIEDLGCGTGALSAATLDLLYREDSSMPVSLELVDKSRAFLDAASHGLQQFDASLSLVTRQQRLDEYLSRESRKGEEENGAVVWHQLGYVWNEIAHNPKTVQTMLRHLAQGLKQGRRLITLVEPANQDQARGAMQLREELCQMGYQVLYPCSHSDACPMLERTRDWCYSEWEWQQPPLMQKVDKILEVDRRRLGASAYVFASPDIAMALRTFKKSDGLGEAIVVGRPLDEKANKQNTWKFNYLLCSAEGLTKVPVDAGPERPRGVVWHKMEKPVVTPVKSDKPVAAKAKPEVRAIKERAPADKSARVPSAKEKARAVKEAPSAKEKARAVKERAPAEKSPAKARKPIAKKKYGRG